MASFSTKQHHDFSLFLQHEFLLPHAAPIHNVHLFLFTATAPKKPPPPNPLHEETHHHGSFSPPKIEQQPSPQASFSMATNVNAKTTTSPSLEPHRHVPPSTRATTSSGSRSQATATNREHNGEFHEQEQRQQDVKTEHNDAPTSPALQTSTFDSGVLGPPFTARLVPLEPLPRPQQNPCSESTFHRRRPLPLPPSEAFSGQLRRPMEKRSVLRLSLPRGE